jgi:mevalonate kinase|tara:strand:+ start:18788 stop:19684 length:897 start_codon:yes stop_codon:yes gene_type:complete
MNNYYSNGKVLLSGEYGILYGAVGIGLPTKMGQNLLIHNRNDDLIEWISFNMDKKVWFNCDFKIDNLNIIKTNEINIAKRLQKILIIVRELNRDILRSGKTIITSLDFDFRWGLGSSSTLINNLAQWAKIDPYKLLNETFGGSGYDIACASNNSPILFSLNSNKQIIKPVVFNPKFKKNLFFIYQNNKQNSQKSIKDFKKKISIEKSTLEKISKISLDLLSALNVDEFTNSINCHEKIISKLLKINPLIEKFPDYKGAVKSLGAWGGDFFLAIGPINSLEYFKRKGFNIGYNFKDFIL